MNRPTAAAPDTSPDVAPETAEVYELTPAGQAYAATVFNFSPLMQAALLLLDPTGFVSQDGDLVGVRSQDLERLRTAVSAEIETAVSARIGAVA